jgi:hypothetical protein
MKRFLLYGVLAFCLFFPAVARAQNTGRIECPRDDGYVYLYSSITTLEVRATLQCGEVVQVTGRYDEYFGVRNAKGDTGFVPLAALVLLKDQPGTGLPTPAAAGPARERIHYDDGPREASTPAHSTAPAFTLQKDTPIRVKLLKTISSTTSRAGDPVEFEILDDVFVEAVPVVIKGSKASGLIAESEPKKRFGHGGKLAFTITSLRLADGQQVNVRCYQSASGTSNTSSADGALSLAPGKDAVLLQNAEFTALIDADVPLKRESFAAPASPLAPPPGTPSQTSQPKL